MMNLKDALTVLSSAGKAKILMALAACAIVLTSAVTFGSWTVASSAGSGYAKAVTASNLTFTDVSASTVADLYPGGTGNVKIRVTNPNAFGVTITAVNLDTGSITSDKGAPCTASTGVSFTNQTGLSLALAGGATTTFTLTGAAAMTNASVTSCQGGIFTIPVTLVATS
jgi:hypothetical protein